MQKLPFHIGARDFHIGMRNVKTALAATLCACLYFIIHRNPTFACIGAIFGMGSDMGDSRLNGGNRFFGTIIGGLLGMGLFWVYTLVMPGLGDSHNPTEGRYHPLLLLLLFVGVILLVLASRLCHWMGAIQPGGVVLCIILFNTPVDTYVSYSLNRMLDTGIGVAMALLVNWLLPRERLVAWLEALHLRKKVQEQ